MDFSKFKPGQKQTITTLDKTLFVAAGAGSGKTFTLTQRVAWALMEGSGKDGKPFLDSLDQVLIITFTNAAAAEIKERVRSTLANYGLVQASYAVDSAWISTIHGMCARILRTHALTLGLDPDFTMLGDLPQVQLRDAAIEEVLKAIETDEQQKEYFAPLFAAHPARDKQSFGAMPGVAGSSRQAVRDDSGQSVAGMARDLLVAITNSPVGFDKLLFPGRAGKDPSGWCQELLNAYVQLAEAGRTADKPVDLIDELTPSIEALTRWPLQHAPHEQTPEALLELLSTLVRPNGTRWAGAACRDLCRELQHALEDAAFDAALAQEHSLSPLLVEIAQRIQQVYAAKKARLSCLDNDDLLTMAYDALKTHPEIARCYTDKFKLVMVDEFQDTSEQQVQMIKLLAGKDACHLTTVGDAQQSIYRFRGADVDVFRRRQQELSDEHKPVLFDNFRSHDDILRFVKAVCGADGMIDNFMDLIASRDEEKIRAEHPFKADGSPRVYVELVKHNYAVTNSMVQHAAAEQLADRIAWFVHKKGVAPADICLLMGRLTNSQLFVDALQKRHIESVITGGSGFAQALEVRIVSDLLCVLANPHDSTRLFNVLTSDLFALDADDLLLLGTMRDPQTQAWCRYPIHMGLLDDAFNENPAVSGDDSFMPSARLQNALRVLRRAWQDMVREPVYRVVQQVFHQSGWLARLEHTTAANEVVAANLLACVRYIREIADEQKLGISQIAPAFETWLSQAKTPPAMLIGQKLNAVSVMTIHASKGLQFPVVAVADSVLDPHNTAAEQGIKTMYEAGNLYAALRPSSTRPSGSFEAPEAFEDCKSLAEYRAFIEQRDYQQEMEEKIRLLYVALTRAQEALILQVAFKIKKDGISPEFAQKVARIVDPTPMELVGMPTIRLELGSVPVVLRSVALAGEKKNNKLVNVLIDDPANCGVEEALQPLLPVDSLSDDGQEDTTAPPRAPEPVTATQDDQAQTRSAAFDFTHYEPVSTPEPTQLPYGLHQGIYSYSSMHALLDAQGEGASEDSRSSSHNKASARKKTPAGKIPETYEYSYMQTKPDDALFCEEVTPTHDDDLDDENPCATNLGSAFHELAQMMIQTGKPVDDPTIERLARSWDCTKCQTLRLKEALQRWTNSDIRRRALSYDRVIAEAPFFCERLSDFGRYIEGAIDLLCTSRNEHNKKEALVIDYKTGDAQKTPQQLYDTHELQAKLYADVLLRQGFTSVECAFVCVERDDGQGQPIVVQYTFS